MKFGVDQDGVILITPRPEKDIPDGLKVTLDETYPCDEWNEPIIYCHIRKGINEYLLPTEAVGKVVKIELNSCE